MIQIILVTSRAEISNLWYLMPDDLRWNLCSNDRNKVHNKYNVLETFPNHPPTLVHGKTVFHENMKTVSSAERLGTSALRARKCKQILP